MVGSNVVRVDGNSIADWTTFHSVFARALGFPAYYGHNMNAWIDCMTYANDRDAAMVGQPVPPGSVLTILVDNGGEFAARCPEQYAALIDATVVVNQRRLAHGEPAVLALAFS